MKQLLLATLAAATLAGAATASLDYSFEDVISDKRVTVNFQNIPYAACINDNVPAMIGADLNARYITWYAETWGRAYLYEFNYGTYARFWINCHYD